MRRRALRPQRPPSRARPAVFFAFVPFQLGANAIVTEERRRQLDTSLRIAGAPLGAIMLARFVSEGVIAVFAAGAFTLTGYLLANPLFLVMPAVVFDFSVTVALSCVIYGQLMGSLFHKASNAASMLFFQIVVAITFLFVITYVPDVAGSFFGLPMNWWSVLGFAQNLGALVQGIFMSLDGFSRTGKQLPIKYDPRFYRENLDQLTGNDGPGYHEMLAPVNASALANATFVTSIALENRIISPYSLSDHLNFLWLDVFVLCMLTWWIMHVRPG